MDPIAAYDDMDNAIDAGEWGEATAIAHDLIEWKRKGGFWPASLPNLPTMENIEWACRRVHGESARAAAITTEGSK